MTSAVYAIGDGRVLKIHSGRLEQDYLPSLNSLYHRLPCDSLSIAVPLIHEHGAGAGICYHIERRLRELWSTVSVEIRTSFTAQP